MGDSQMPSEPAVETSSAATISMKFELVVIPVSVDRASEPGRR